jgi:hypothetical protein
VKICLLSEKFEISSLFWLYVGIVLIKIYLNSKLKLLSMLEFSYFKSQLESYQAPNPLANNIRYSLSKKKIDVLFSPLFCLMSLGTFCEMALNATNSGTRQEAFGGSQKVTPGHPQFT